MIFFFPAAPLLDFGLKVTAAVPTGSIRETSAMDSMSSSSTSDSCFWDFLAAFFEAIFLLLALFPSVTA